MSKIIVIILLTVIGSNGIKRDDVLKRASLWVNKVPYSQSQFFPDPQGRSYRTDCSGYVSMAWQLYTSLTTVSIPIVAKKIDKNELMAGDVICNCGGGPEHSDGHVLIFEKWTNDNRTEYLAYEQHGPKGSLTSHWIVPYPFRHNDHRYEPYRYNHIE